MLKRCTQCDSFVVSDVCGHCGSHHVRTTKLGVVATMVGSSAFAMTLMACYGMPADEYRRYDTGTDASSQDNDGSAATDAGNADASATDASATDASATDGGTEASAGDASSGDASSGDAGTPDAEADGG